MATTTYAPEAVADGFAAVPTRVAPSRIEMLQWLRRALLACVIVLAPAILYHCLTESMTDLTADHRLAPSFGLVHGYKLYYPAENGPVLSTIYGPVTALIYLPATLASTPAGAMLIAALITLVLFYGGGFVALREAVRGSWLKWWQLLAVVIGVTWTIPPVQRAATAIHADAPALAFAAIAAAFAMRSVHRVSRWENEILAGAFCVASVLAKQNMLPLAVGLAGWIFVRSRWKGLTVFGASAIVGSAAMMALVEFRLGGVRAFLFNCYHLPKHQPYDKALLFPAWSQLVVSSFALLAIPMFLLLRDWLQSEGDWREFLQDRKTLLLLLLGLALVPTSIMGRLKYGAIESALCPALFFFALFLIAELARVQADAKVANESRFALIPVLLFCIATGMPAVYLAANSKPNNPVQQVYEYSKANQGKVYFPQFPLAQLMAEGQLYHFSWGLNDRRAAGVPITEAHFAANVPQQASVMAILPWVPEWDNEVAKRHGEEVDLAGTSQLRGFQFFAMNQLSH
jgi:hypothetical protein